VPILICAISLKTYNVNKSNNRLHFHDLGASSENMFLEALNHGLIMHEMAGFDLQKARVSFNIHEEFEIGIMISLGYQDTFCHHFNACLRASTRYVMRFGCCLMNRLYIYDTTSIISNFMLLFFPYA